MARVKTLVRNIAQKVSLDATVIAVMGNKANVRLSKGGRFLHGLDVYGGPVAIGDEVKIGYQNGIPYVQASKAGTYTVVDEDGNNVNVPIPIDPIPPYPPDPPDPARNKYVGDHPLGSLDPLSAGGWQVNQDEDNNIEKNNLAINSSGTIHSRNQYGTVAAIGNLDGFYGYSGTIYGAGIGPYYTSISGGMAYLVAEAINGIQIYYREGTGTNHLITHWSTSGNIILGEEESDKANIFIGGGNIYLRYNTVKRLELTNTNSLRINDANGNVMIHFDPMGEITYASNLVAYRNLASYTGYIYVPLAAPLTSTSWDGDAFSDTSSTKIDLSAVFGAPNGIKAVLFEVLVSDSASSGGDYYLGLGNGSSNIYVRCSYYPNNALVGRTVICPCDSSGDVYYLVNASGSGTMTIYLQIWGYWL